MSDRNGRKRKRPRLERHRFRSLVLCYHAVSATWPHNLSVSAHEFERQLRILLLRRYRPVTAADVVAGPPRAFHVTFDDAFKSVAEALPILARLRIPATVFACTAYADGGRPLDVPELAADAAARPQDLATMTWDELRAVVDSGIEVGSHTVTHPHLTHLSDEELVRELAGSRRRLSDELGRPCRFLAYPYGDEDERVHAVARAAGFGAAFALPGRFDSSHRYAIPRVGVWRQDGSMRFTLKTSTLRGPAENALIRVRARARARRPPRSPGHPD